jgi:ABC-2 type transport system ATP-binding protein
MIEVKGLTKYFGRVPAIEDVTFSAGQGEVTGFLGPNGAGKSTTMRILTGFMPATRGRAIVAGFDVGDNPLEVKYRVGYMPESVPLYGEMIVERFLLYVAEVKGVARSVRRREVGRVMERCGLAHMARRIVRNLSKGYRQRVGLAQALIGGPPVLILDEPTVGLDPKQIVEIRQMIKGLAEDHTVLLSTHILPEVAMVCGRVVIIHQGRVVAEDTVGGLAETGGRVVEVEVDGPAGWITESLRHVPGVTRVTDQGGHRYLVEFTGDGDVSPAIVKRLVEGGLGVRRVEGRRKSLEDVFMEAISVDEGGRS